MRIDPDADLEPGYCDLLQLVAGDNSKGFIFLEWSRDERPRLFRYVVRPMTKLWNPTGAAWESLPASKRPMVQVERAPFAGNKWTHILMTFDRLNSGKKGVGRLYLNGALQGEVAGWDQTYGWDAEKVRLYLGVGYIGYIDDLAIFDRALTDKEVRTIYEMPNGIAELYTTTPTVPSR